MLRKENFAEGRGEGGANFEIGNIWRERFFERFGCGRMRDFIFGNGPPGNLNFVRLIEAGYDLGIRRGARPIELGDFTR